LLGGLFFGLQTNRKWLTDPNLKSQYLQDVKRTQDEATSLFNDLASKPDMSGCSNTKRKRNALSERQLRSLLLDRSIIGSIAGAISGAVNDVSKLISCSLDVVNNLSKAVEGTTPDIVLVENLTDTLAEIAKDLEEDDNQQSSTQESSSGTSTSSGSSSSSSSSSSSANNEATEVINFFPADVTQTDTVPPESISWLNTAFLTDYTESNYIGTTAGPATSTAPAGGPSSTSANATSMGSPSSSSLSNSTSINTACVVTS
jgi:hypothetical protein